MEKIRVGLRGITISNGRQSQKFLASLRGRVLQSETAWNLLWCCEQASRVLIRVERTPFFEGPEKQIPAAISHTDTPRCSPSACGSLDQHPICNRITYRQPTARRSKASHSVCHGRLNRTQGQRCRRQRQWGWGEIVGKYFDPVKINARTGL